MSERNESIDNDSNDPELGDDFDPDFDIHDEYVSALSLANDAADVPKLIPPEDVPDIERRVKTFIKSDEESSDYVAPWHQQPKEQDASFTYFRHFRDLGSTRTLRKVSDHFGKSYNYIMNLSAKNDWTDRAKKFDHYREQVYQRELSLAIRETAERHAATVARTISAIAAPIEALRHRANEPDFVQALMDEDPTDLVRLASQSAKILPVLMSAERLARGMPSELVQIQGTIDHTHEIVPAERDQLGEILAVLDEAGLLDARGLSGGPEEIIDAEVVSVHQEQTVDP